MRNGCSYISASHWKCRQPLTVDLNSGTMKPAELRLTFSMRTPLVASSKSSATSFRLTAEHPGGLIRCARMTGAFGLSVCCKFSEAPRAGVFQSSLELARRSIRRLPLDIFRGCCASMCVTTSLHHVCVKGLHASIGTTLCCRAGSSGSPVAATWRATGWRTRSTGRSLSAPPPSGPATGTSGATGALMVRLAYRLEHHT